MPNQYMGQDFAAKLGELAGLAPEDKEVVAYGLEYLLSSIISASLTLLAGLTLGLFHETLAVLFCWGLLRLFAGGSHCTARWRCTVTSLIGMLAVVLIAKIAVSLVPATVWVALCMAWALAAVWLWAPNNSARTISVTQKRLLRRWALALVPALSIIILYLANVGTGQIQAVAVAGATGFAAGAFMLSPAGFWLLAWCDRTLELMHHTLCKGGEIP